jgi:hypothetical protein
VHFFNFRNRFRHFKPSQIPFTLYSKICICSAANMPQSDLGCFLSPDASCCKSANEAGQFWPCATLPSVK